MTTIRQRIIETYIPSHYIETDMPKYSSSWFSSEVVLSGWEKRQVYVDSKTHKETILEYLNPESGKWETLPTVYDEVNIPRNIFKKA